MNFKLTLILIATIIGIVAYYPYIKDILSLKTKPHTYTWLIWALTQGTAVYGIWLGGGGVGALNLVVGTFLVIVVFFFSLKYGTKNVTKTDLSVLIAAIIAIIVWWQLKQPIISVLMVSVIDLIGYFPSFRKTYQEPWSETQLSWLLFALSNIFAIAALSQYNILTTFYISTLTLANLVLFFICVIRRKKISK